MAYNKRQAIERRYESDNVKPYNAGWYDRETVDNYIDNGANNSSVISNPEFTQKREEQRALASAERRRSRVLDVATGYINNVNSYLRSGNRNENTRSALVKQSNDISNYLKQYKDDLDDNTLKELDSAMAQAREYLKPVVTPQPSYKGYNNAADMLADMADKKASMTGILEPDDNLVDRTAKMNDMMMQGAKQAYESNDPMFQRYPSNIQMMMYDKPETYTKDNYSDYWGRIEALANQSSWTPALKDEARAILEAAGGGTNNMRFENDLKNKLQNGEITADEYNNRMRTFTSLQNKYNGKSTAFTGGVFQGAGGQSLGTALNNALPSDAWTQLQNDIGFSAAENPTANQAGNMAGRLALMYVLGQAAAPLGAAVASGVGGTAGGILGSAASSAATFGAESAIQKLGEASTTGEWGKYARDIGVSSLAGAAGGAASTGAYVAGSKLITGVSKHLADIGKEGIETKFAEYVNRVASTTAFGAARTGVETGAKAISGEEINRDEIAQELVMSFAYALINSSWESFKTSEAGAKLLGTKYTEAGRLYKELAESINPNDPKDVNIQKLNELYEMLNIMENDLNTTYYPGQQKTITNLRNGISDMKAGLEMMAYSGAFDIGGAKIGEGAFSDANTFTSSVNYPLLEQMAMETINENTAVANTRGDISAPTITPPAVTKFSGTTTPAVPSVPNTPAVPKATESPVISDRLPTTANTDPAIIDKVAKNYVKADMPALAEALKTNLVTDSETPVMDYVDEMTSVYGAVQTQLNNNETIDQKAMVAMSVNNGGEVNLSGTQILAATNAAISDHFKLVVNNNKAAGSLQKPATNATINPIETKGEITNVRTEEAGEPRAYSTEGQSEINQISTGESVSKEWWQPARAERTENPQWKVSSLKELSGISAGSSDKINVINTADIKGSNTLTAINRQNSAVGINTYLYRGNVSRAAGETTVNANAFNVNGDVYIPADVSPERARVLAGHEYHEVLESRYPEFKTANRSEVARVANILPKDSSGETSYDKMLNTLKMAYKQDAPDLTEAQVEDEIIHDIYAGLDASEGLFEEWFGEQFTQDIRQIQSALKKNADTFVREAQKSGKIAFRTDAGEVAAESHSPVGFSLELAPQIAETSVKGAKKYGKDVDEYKEVSDKVLDLANYMKKVTMDENGNIKTDVNGNPLIPDERFISNNIFSNASYLKDAEPTTECFRQLVYFSFQEKVSDILKRPLTEKEAIIANQAVAEIGIEAPCLYCYSLMDRKAKEAYKIRYVDERNAFMDLFDSEYGGNKEKFGKDRNKNFDRYLNLYMTRALDPSVEGTNTSRNPVNDDKKARVKLWMDEYQYLYHEPTDVATLNDVRNWDADQTLANAYKSIPDAKIRNLKQAEIKDLQYWAQSASQAKKRVEYAAYSNVKKNGKDLAGILTWKQPTIDALNNEYGLRWYSHAEYHPAFTVDNIQQIVDASIRGLKGLMYTKELDAVKIVAPSGMNINLSCFAKLAPDGKTYISDDALGANWDEIKALREKFPNVGSVMVVTNDDMLFWAISQDWIDCVIPLHKVRSGDVFMKEFGLTNYTPYQEDKLTDKQLYEKFIADICQAKNITDEKQIKKLTKDNKVLLPKDHNNSYEQYATELAKRGLTARFNNILQEILAGKEYNGVPITTDMYMKLVNETRMPMDKIEPLKPVFDFDAAKSAINTLAEKGYYNYFKPSSQWTNREGQLVSMTADDWAQQAAEDIKAGTPISKLGYGRDLAWDASKGKYIETAAEAKAAGVGGVHDNVGFSVELDTKYLQQYAPTFYHKSQRVLEESKQNKFAANAVIPMLKGKGIKDDEIKWSGIQEFLDGKKSVTKDELLSYMSDNQLEIEETTLSDSTTNAFEDELIAKLDELDISPEDVIEPMDGLINTYMVESELDWKLDEGEITEETKTEIMAIANRLDFEREANEGTQTHWQQYKLDGGENYREILFKMPGSDYSNRSMDIHWQESGVLAHARVQDFNDASGNKVLFVEEIQSDWHNAGAKYGYKGNKTETTYDIRKEWQSNRAIQEIVNTIVADGYNGVTKGELWNRFKNAIRSNTLDYFPAEIKSAYGYEFSKDEGKIIDGYAQRFEKALNAQYAAPDAPFKNNYTDFVLKSLLRQAAENGYDYLAWTTAEMQMARWNPERQSTYQLTFEGASDDVAFEKGYQIEYDQDIPKFLKKYGKQWGANLSNISIVAGENFDSNRGYFNDELPVPAIEINNAMRESVLYAGQSMFSIQLNPDTIKKAYLQYYDPQRWQADRVGDPEKNPMPLADIVAKIRHDYNINITTGHVRGKGVRGTYDLRNKGVRTKLVNDLPTISHELGHAIDDRGKIVENAPKDIRQELGKILNDSQRLGQIGQYPAKEIPFEGFAEYIREYLQDSAKTAADYPKVTEYLKKNMSAKDLAQLENLADEVNAYYALDADTATSSIKLRENKANDFRTVGEKIHDVSSSWYQAWVDSNKPFKDIDKAVGSNTYMYATNSAYSDSIAGEIILGDLTDMNGQYVGEGLRTVLSGVNIKNKKEYMDFGEYLIMRHAEEFMYGDEGNVRRVFADDRKNNPAFFRKREKELAEQYPAFEKAADALYEFKDNLVRTWGIATGLINETSYDELREKYKYHVPFYRVMEKGTSSAQSARRGFANQNSPIRRAKGSGLDIVHPVDSIISDVALYVNAGTRNNVMLELRKAALELGVDANFMEKIPTPMVPKTFSTAAVKGKVADQVSMLLDRGAINQETADVLSGALQNIEDTMLQFSKGRASGDIVTVLVDGSPEFWKINDPSLLQSIGNMSPTKLHGVIEMYAKTTRFLTAMITGNNPIWSVFSNAPRDLGTFIGYFKDKKQLPKAIASIGVGYVNSFRENALGGKKVDPLYKEYLAMGGGHTSVYSADTDIAKKARKKFTSTKFQKAMSMMNPLNGLSFITDTIEQGPRFATYRMCRMGGMTPQEAFYEAMDITVNFRKAGTISRDINKIVPFFNASVQGVDKFARYFSGADVPPEKRAAAIRSRVGMYLGVSAVLAGLFYAINNGDEQRKKEYQQLSNYTKNNFWCIPIGDGKYFTVPKPRELTVLTSFFETIMEYGIGGNKHAFDEFYEYAVDNFFPSVVSDILKIPANIAKDGFGDGLKNTGLDALGSMGVIGIIANVGANRDFLGRSIESASLTDVEAKQRYTSTTSWLAYAIGQALNWSPQRIDYVGNNALGYLWKVQKALFPVGAENRDYSLGVKSSYVKDNQYSTDLVNWLYDSSSKSDMAAASYPNDMDKKLAAKLDGNMKTFYGRFNNLNKNNSDLESKRTQRQIVLDMILGHREQSDSGEMSEVQQKAYATAKAAYDMSLLPAVMDTNVKDSDKVQYNLNDVQYLEYQTKYNDVYWSYVENNIDLVDSLQDRIAVLDTAKKNAKKEATNYILRKLGVDTGETPELQAAQTQRNEQWSQTTLLNAIKDTSIGANMDKDQSSLVNKWINTYLSGENDSWMTKAEEKNIDIETAMLFELALRKYDTGSKGNYDGIDTWNALNNLTELSANEKDKLWSAYGIKDTTFSNYKRSKKYETALKNRKGDVGISEPEPEEEQAAPQEQTENHKNEGYVPVSSDWIAGIEYDNDTGVLYVTTNSGKTYKHSCSYDQYIEFKNSDSKGKYYNSHFK